MQRRVLAATILAVILTLAYDVVPTRTPGAAVPDARKPAPDFNLTDSSGARVKLSDYKGKVILLNFWATWCHGCGLEIPWFIEFQDKFRDRGLVVLGVSMDDDGWKSVKPYVKEKKINYTVALGDERMGTRYGLGGMPMTVLIDRGGKIAASYSGVVDKDGCEQQIRTLVQENAGS